MTNAAMNEMNTQNAGFDVEEDNRLYGDLEPEMTEEEFEKHFTEFFYYMLENGIGTIDLDGETHGIKIKAKLELLQVGDWKKEEKENEKWSYWELTQEQQSRRTAL